MDKFFLFLAFEFFVLLVYGGLAKDAYENKNRFHLRNKELCEKLSASERLKILFRAHLYVFAFFAAFAFFAYLFPFLFENNYDGPEPYLGRP